ncbi:MAG: SDR family oxidoreductase [Halieaceae bacterium]|jgi:3-oxoacyl-[acyl-carrier protein] reductase|nr:SDR family oxidoreductase [Halieaceae bacterium]
MSELLLKDKVAMITGGSSGIGAAIARLFAEEGATVAVVASSDTAKAQRIVDVISQSGGRGKAFSCNVEDLAQINHLVSDVENALGPVDILVNSAGVFFPTLIGETSEADFDRMVSINLKGPFFLIDCIAPGMIARQRGKIINVSSVSAFVGSKQYGLYGAVKAGLVSLTKTFALQLAPHNINVNAIAPGNTATPINQDIRTEPEFAERRAMIESSTPSQRLFSEPEDIAQTALFLASDRSRAMHGSTLLADEGRAAGL